MFCQKCGKRNDDGRNFCSDCGAKLVSGANPAGVPGAGYGGVRTPINMWMTPVIKAVLICSVIFLPLALIGGFIGYNLLFEEVWYIPSEFRDEAYDMIPHIWCNLDKILFVLLPVSCGLIYFFAQKREMWFTISYSSFIITFAIAFIVCLVLGDDPDSEREAGMVLGAAEYVVGCLVGALAWLPGMICSVIGLVKSIKKSRSGFYY